MTTNPGGQAESTVLSPATVFVAVFEQVVAGVVADVEVSLALLDDMPTGPALAALLAATDPSMLTPPTQLSYLAASERQLAWTQAVQNRGLVAFAGVQRISTPYQADGRVLELSDVRRSEVALELNWSETMAAARLATARALAADLPTTKAALEAGAVCALRAQAIVEGATRLTTRVDDLLDRVRDAETRQELLHIRHGLLDCFQTRVVPYAEAHDLSRTRGQVARTVARLDPRGAAMRRAAAIERASDVTVRHDLDGMGTLTATLPSEQAVACLRAIDALAKDSTHADMTERIGIRRVAALTALLAGGATAAGVRVHLNVTIDHTTLLGLRDGSAMLEGIGPIPAATVRAMVASRDASIRWLTTTPAGVVADVSRRYAIGDQLRALITTRDTLCRIPTCNRPAEACDIDHVTPYGSGGHTEAANLIPLCRRHHQLKTHAGFMLRATDDGQIQCSPPHASPRTLPAEPANELDNAWQRLHQVHARIAELEAEHHERDEDNRTPTADEQWRAHELDEHHANALARTYASTAHHIARHGLLHTILTDTLRRHGMRHGITQGATATQDSHGDEPPF